MQKCRKAKCKLHLQWENIGNGISGALYFKFFLSDDVIVITYCHRLCEGEARCKDVT